MRHVENTASDLDHHEVRVVRLRNSSHNVGLLHARAHKNILVEAYALQGVTIEIAVEIRERRGIAVNDAHVAVALGKQRCKLRANTPAANDDDIRHTPAFRPTPRSTAR